MMRALTFLTAAVTALLTLAARGASPGEPARVRTRPKAAGVALMQVATLAHDRRGSVPTPRRAVQEVA